MVMKTQMEVIFQHKRLLIIPVLILLAIPLALAADPSFYFEQNKNVDLKISCFDENNTLCGDDTFCTITINNPDASNLVKNATMTYNYNFYNYTIQSADTLDLGEYAVITNCYGADKGFSTFSYEITSSGKPSSIGFFFLILGVSIVVLCIGIFSRNIPITILGGFMMTLVGLYTLNNGVDGNRNFMTEWLSIIITLVGGLWAVKAAGEYLDGW